MQLSGFSKFLVLFLLTFIGIGILIFAIAIPMIGRVQKMSEEYLSNEETIMKLYNRDAVVSSLNSEIDQTKNKTSQIDGAFLITDNLASFIEDLEKIAALTNNQIEIQTGLENNKGFSESGEQASELDKSVLFQVTLTGNFNNLIQYIANLENIPSPPYRLIEIKNLRISQLEQESGMLLKSTINLRVYTQ